MAGRLQRTSDWRGFLPLGEFSKKREQCPLDGLNFSKGAASMSRIRLLQAQGTTRRDGQTQAPAAGRLCSRTDNPVRCRLDPLG
jgi:hypothetical protein